MVRDSQLLAIEEKEEEDLMEEKKEEGWNVTHGVGHGGGLAISDDHSDPGHAGSGPHVLGKHLSAERVQGVGGVGAASHVVDVVDTLQQRGSETITRHVGPSRT